MHGQLRAERDGGGAPAPRTAARRSRSTAPARIHAGINPLTLQVLAEAGIDASWARSKSVTEFLGQSFDYVVTVCDEARQVCPVFPGAAGSLHWGYEDPADAVGTDEERLAVFRRVLIQLERAGQPVHPAGRAGAAAPSGARVMELYLLRHADAGDPMAWEGPDESRPLSDKGERPGRAAGALPGRVAVSGPTRS